MTGSAAIPYRLAATSPFGSQTTGYVMPCALKKRRASPERSFAVDAEDDDALAAIVAPEPLERRRLALARTAPGGPEVEHDGLAAQRGERERPLPVEPAEREGGRAAAPTFGGGVWCVSRQTSTVRSAATPATASACAPSFSRAGTSRPYRYFATMKTGVPTVTWSNSHSADGTCIRMQPCDTE